MGFDRVAYAASVFRSHRIDYTRTGGEFRCKYRESDRWLTFNAYTGEIEGVNHTRGVRAAVRILEGREHGRIQN